MTELLFGTHVGWHDLFSLSFLGAAVFVVAAVLALHFDVPARAKVTALLCVGVAIRLFVATRDPVSLQYWPMNEDAYYYFTIARNLVQGAGLRHDSFDSTTGFQPLFLLTIVPLFRFIHDKLLVINAVLVLQSILGAFGGLLMYQLGRLWSGASAGVLALAIWATSPVFLSLNLNGLETNTSIFMLLATLYYYFSRFRSSEHVAPRYATYAKLGLLCGTGFLARIDLGFLIPILGLDLLLRPGPGETDTLVQRCVQKLPLLLVFGVAALLPMLPWLLYNLAVNGTILPSSGQAIRFLSIAYGYHLLVEGPAAAARYFEPDQIPADYYQLMIRTAAHEVMKIMRGTFPLWAAAVLLATAAWLSLRRLVAETWRMVFVWVFVVAIFFSYTCYIFGYWFFDRYLTPFAVAWLLLMLGCVATIRAHWQSHVQLRRAATVFVPAALGVLLYNSLHDIQRTLASNEHSKFYDVAAWLNTNTPKDAVIGAFQTGITGYFIERRFYGLDGKINIDALRAMKDKRMDLYVQEKRIDYLVDWTWILDDLFTRRSSDPGFLARQKRVWHGQADVYDLRPEAHPATP